jgi:hypothetical protein
VGRVTHRSFIALATAALLALGLLPASLVSAAPAPPELIKSDQVDQVGLWNPDQGLYAAGWVSVSVRNPGTSSYTQMRLVVRPSAGAPLVALAALDPSFPEPVSSSLCQIVDNAFHCAWPGSLGGGASTPPIRFVFGGTQYSPAECLAANPPLTCDNVVATFSSKDSTTTSGGGSSQPRDANAERLIAIKIDSKTEERTNFSPPNTPITLTTWKGGNQRSAIALPASSKGYIANLKELSSDSEAGPLYGCDLSGTYGNLVYASINQGSRVKPYVEWTLTITMPTSEAPAGGLTSVVHCVANPAFDPGLPASSSNPLYVTQSITSACPKSGSWSDDPSWQGCIVSIRTSTSGKDKATTTYTIKARTPSNYLLKGR